MTNPISARVVAFRELNDQYEKCLKEKAVLLDNYARLRQRNAELRSAVKNAGEEQEILRDLRGICETVSAIKKTLDEIEIPEAVEPEAEPVRPEAEAGEEDEFDEPDLF
jgi:hypothetical protein